MRFLVLPLFFCSVCLGALEFSEIRTELTFKPEFHRSLGFCDDFAAAGELVIQDSYALQGGIALGQTGKNFDLDIFVGGSYLLPLPASLKIRLLYIYNTIPAYIYHTNTLFPLLSFQGKWGGADLGTILRFTTFDPGAPAIFEPVLGVRLFIGFPSLGPLKLTTGIGNFSVFNTGNLGAYFLFLESNIDMNGLRLVKSLREKWDRAPLISLINNLEFYQTGSIALTSAFQGFAWQGGVRLSW
jgi:hypothetical protein